MKRKKEKRNKSYGTFPQLNFAAQKHNFLPLQKPILRSLLKTSDGIKFMYTESCHKFCYKGEDNGHMACQIPHKNLESLKNLWLEQPRKQQ